LLALAQRLLPIRPCGERRPLQQHDDHTHVVAADAGPLNVEARLKSKFEISSSCLSFKRRNQAQSTRGKPGFKLHFKLEAKSESGSDNSDSSTGVLL
jgi:hypothetical protein